MSEITITLAGRPDLDPEERRQRALRAKEVLSGAGWLFDEYISELTRDLVATTPEQATRREELYHQIDAAAQVKGRLHQIIEQQAAHEKVNERRISKLPPADHE